MVAAAAVAAVCLAFFWRLAGSNIETPPTISEAVAFGSLPAASAANASRVFFLTDGYHALRSAGSAFAYFGPVHPLTQPPAGFAWVNQGGATVTDVGALIVTAPTGGGGLRLRCKSAPAVPYTLTVAFEWKVSAVNNSSCGFWFRQASTEELAGVIVQRITGNVEILSAKWTNATTFSAPYVSESAPGVLMQLGIAQHPVFLRLADDNTNRVISFSKNGRDFFQFHSVTRTDFLTADELCFGAGTAATGETSVNTLYSWKEE